MAAIAETKNLAQFARDVGVSINAAWQWKEGKRPVPAHHCKKIVEISKGKVSLQDLRPDDWIQIWPELAEQEAA